MAKKQTHVIRIYNSSKQMIPIQVKPPAGDFYLHEQQIQLYPGRDVTLPKDHVIEDQISNLKSKAFIQVTYDSSTLEE